jgi:hypothetical protein
MTSDKIVPSSQGNNSCRPQALRAGAQMEKPSPPRLRQGEGFDYRGTVAQCVALRLLRVQHDSVVTLLAHDRKVHVHHFSVTVDFKKDIKE